MKNKEELQLSILSKKFIDYKNILLLKYPSSLLDCRDTIQAYILLVMHKSTPFIVTVDQTPKHLFLEAMPDLKESRHVYTGFVPTEYLISYLQGKNTSLLSTHLKEDLNLKLKFLCEHQLTKINSLTKYIAGVNAFISHPKPFSAQNINKLHGMCREVVDEFQ